MLGAKLEVAPYLARLNQEIERLDQAALRRWADLIYVAWEQGKFVYIIGNGGSACNASHMAEDLGKSSLRESDLKDESKKRLKVLSLTDNVGWLLAVGNDVGYDQIFVGPTNTDRNNNTSPTAASSGTDLNGAAVLDACSRLKQRLATFAAGLFADAPGGVPSLAEDVLFADGFAFDRRNPLRRIAWKELIPNAYFERVNLGERGFYTTPGVDFNRETGRGQPFFYFTNGAAVAEVSIDRLTGELSVPRVDLLMDIGVSINPGIDRGQVIGGFVQGMGWVTTEELKYDAVGRLLSHSPTTYKIPNISDLPATFNVTTFPNPDNDVSLKQSSACRSGPR